MNFALIDPGRAVIAVRDRLERNLWLLYDPVSIFGRPSHQHDTIPGIVILRRPTSRHSTSLCCSANFLATSGPFRSRHGRCMRRGSATLHRADRSA
jgi:hypothetical protein